MKKYFILLFALPFLSLVAREGDSENHANYHGNNDYERNLNHYNGENGGYGEGEGWGIGYDPDYQSDPGQVDDSSALYESYLQSNPRVPSVPVD